MLRSHVDGGAPGPDYPACEDNDNLSKSNKKAFTVNISEEQSAALSPPAGR